MKHTLEYILLISLQWMLKRLPLEKASALGGWLGRSIGPRTPKQAIARAQLRHFFPELPPKKREVILKDMWDNIGRTAAEFLCIPSAELMARIHVTTPENMAPRGTPAIYLTAHMGNWELLPYIIKRHGSPATIMHRRASNPKTAAIIEAQRLHFADALATKSAQGLAACIKALKEGQTVGMLTDQRISSGIERPFLGVPAFTSSLPAELAVKYGVKLIPAHIVRTGKCQFEVTIYPEIRWDPSGNASADIERLTDAINAHYERWIRAHPAQWLWFHERWGKGKFT